MSGKYDPLEKHLTKLAVGSDPAVLLRFDDIDRWVGGLPSSAKTHRAWWANGSHDHAKSWIRAGWYVAEVSQELGTVRFEREERPGTHSRVSARTERTGASRGAWASKSRGDFDARLLPTVGTLGLRVEFAWREAGRIEFEGPGELKFPRLPAHPGLYRMELDGAPGQARVRIYIGETENLRKRASQYRKPGGPSQTTNVRMNAALKMHLSVNGSVRLCIAVEADVAAEASGSPRALDLASKASRRLLENAALVQAYMAGDVEVENIE